MISPAPPAVNADTCRRAVAAHQAGAVGADLWYWIQSHRILTLQPGAAQTRRDGFPWTKRIARGADRGHLASPLEDAAPRMMANTTTTAITPKSG